MEVVQLSPFPVVLPVEMSQGASAYAVSPFPSTAFAEFPAGIWN